MNKIHRLISFFPILIIGCTPNVIENKVKQKINNLDIWIRTSVAAFHGYNFLLARENLTDHLPIEQRKNKTRQKLLKIRAKKVITATGSLERPLIFDNNDRPGILLSSAIKRYADLFGVACGEKNIFLTNNDSAYETAISLIQKGIKVEAIVDNREEIESKLLYEVEKNNIKVFKGFTIVHFNFHYRVRQVSFDATESTRVKFSIHIHPYIYSHAHT